MRNNDQYDSPNANNSSLQKSSNFIKYTIFAIASVYLVKTLSQIVSIQEYFNFLTDFISHIDGYRFYVQYISLIFLYMLMILMLHRVAFYDPFNSIAENWFIYHIVWLFRLIIIVCPTILVGFLFINSLDRNQPASTIWLIIFTILIGLAIQIGINATRYISLMEIFRDKEKIYKAANTIDAITLHPIFFGVSSAACATYILILNIDLIYITNFLGGLGAFLVFILSLATLYAFFQAIRRITGFPAFLIAVAFVLLIQLLPTVQPPREIRHTIHAADPSQPPAPLPVLNHTAATAAKDQVDAGVLDLTDAFEKWVNAHAPGLVEAEPQKNKFPVFLIAAQGGGQYAAYHTALFLAHLYDRCPKLSNHVFAISGVSGGSVGAAFFSEMLRAYNLDSTKCNLQTTEKIFENQTNDFFANDFLAPVLAQGLFMDIPRYVISPMVSSRDRAIALELAMEAAWDDLNPNKTSSGLEKDFLRRWSPGENVPALVLNATAANFGVPMVLSQVRLSQPFKPGFVAQVLSFNIDVFGLKSKNLKDPKRTATILSRAVRNSGYSRPPYFNLLDYRPELQLKVSTAAVISARFPYVTPPAIIRKGDINNIKDPLLKGVEQLQLIDGGFFDNSGLYSVTEIIRQLRSDPSASAKELIKKISFHIIIFGHQKHILQSASTRGYSELISPLATFEAIRQARRISLARDREWSDIKKHYINLFDQEFIAPLSWTLSTRTRAQIKQRSGTGDIKLCCRFEVEDHLPEAIWPSFERYLGPIYLGSEGSELENSALKESLIFTPNKNEFEKIISLIERYAE